MIRHSYVIFGAFAALAACATAASDTPKGVAKYADDPRLGEKVDKICFNRSIDSFSQADRDTVVLREGVNDYYLVEVRGVCSNLRHAQSIAIDSTLSCVSRNDFLIVSTSAFSLNDGVSSPERCMIGDIYAWDKNATEAEPTEEEPS